MRGHTTEILPIKALKGILKGRKGNTQQVQVTSQSKKKHDNKKGSTNRTQKIHVLLLKCDKTQNTETSGVSLGQYLKKIKAAVYHLNACFSSGVCH